MLGNSRGTRIATALLLLALAALAAGCARNVPQHSNSGKDFRIKGAKKIKLEEGEGRTRDIVTYPGGDRIDWKLVELPEGKKGELKIRLKFNPARPGMDVAFEVFDEYFDRVGRAKPAPSGEDRRKTVKVKNAQGKYYVQVYAPRRKDAGKYTLSVEFKEAKGPVVVADADLLADIVEPPQLPAVPQPVAAQPPPVPVGPVQPEPPPPDEEGEGPAVAPTKLKAKVTRVQAASGGGVIVTINKGKKDGVDRGWIGTLLVGSSDTPLDEGNFTVINVTSRESVAKIKLTIDQVKANPKVLLTPP